MADSTNISTGWVDAQEATFNYICTETGYERGVNAFLGDRLPNDKANLFCYIVSGGRDQIQNYQVPTPGYKFFSNAVLRGQFFKMNDAMNFISQLLNVLPAYKDKHNIGQPLGEGLVNRGLSPNVELFESTDHPTLFSDVVEINNKDVQYWIVLANFRIVYNRKQI